MKPFGTEPRSKQGMQALALERFMALGVALAREEQRPVPRAVPLPAARGQARAHEAAPDDETVWVARARQGDAAAFRSLVERHGAHAHGLARRIVRSEADAEEVAQDAFVRAWRALPAFRGESGFRTWLHRIVVRVALDRAAVLRTRAGREQADVAPELHAASAPHDPGAASRAHRLEQLVAALPPMQRAAVTLYYWHDRSVEDVAAAIGCPVNTAKTHLARARAALRAAWLAPEDAR